MSKPRLAPENGTKFGFFTVIREVEKSERLQSDKRYFELLCECGKKVLVDLHRFVRQKNPIKSCGCKTSELTSKHFEYEFQKLIGQKFNMLTILGTSEWKFGKRYVDCLCDCGQRASVMMSNVTSGRQKSCGHLRTIVHSTQVWEVEMRQYKKTTADSRNIPFLISLEQFKSLCQGNCSYCGLQPAIKSRVGGILRNGIDRQDNSRGYEPDNCVSCCSMCNRSKGSMSLDDFLQWIQRLKNFNPPTTT